MKFGFGIPSCREGGSVPVGMVHVPGMIKMAQAADRLGFYSIWFDDWRAPASRMKLPTPEPPNWYEVMVTMAYMSHVTKKVRIGTGVIVLPLREPVLLAKQVATLDALSGGRLFLGVGLGVYREEFDKLYPRSKDAHRGRMLDEMLEALDVLLGQDVANHSGKYYEFKEVALFPKPLQKRIPLYFVGEIEENMERLAQRGSGWLMRPNPQAVRHRLEVVQPFLEKAGRSLSEMDIVSYGVLSLAKTRKEALAKYQRAWVSHRTRGMTDDQVLADHYVGTSAEIIEKVGKLQEAGVTQCVVNTFPADTMDEMVEQAEMYGKEILPAFR